MQVKKKKTANTFMSHPSHAAEIATDSAATSRIFPLNLLSLSPSGFCWTPYSETWGVPAKSLMGEIFHQGNTRVKLPMKRLIHWRKLRNRWSGGSRMPGRSQKVGDGGWGLSRGVEAIRKEARVLSPRRRALETETVVGSVKGRVGSGRKDVNGMNWHLGSEWNMGASLLRHCHSMLPPPPAAFRGLSPPCLLKAQQMGEWGSEKNKT